MGVEHYIINKKNKTFYDLGRGGWHELAYEKEALFDLEYLKLFLRYDCCSYTFDDTSSNYSDADRQELGWHIDNKVAPELFEFAKGAEPKDIELFNDCGDELVMCKSLGYRCVGSRYYDQNSDQGKEDIAYNNRHLEDTPLNKRLYDPNYYKNCEFFRKLIE